MQLSSGKLFFWVFGWFAKGGKQGENHIKSHFADVHLITTCLKNYGFFKLWTMLAMFLSLILLQLAFWVLFLMLGEPSLLISVLCYLFYYEFLTNLKWNIQWLPQQTVPFWVNTRARDRGMFCSICKYISIQWDIDREKEGEDLTVKWLISSTGNSQLGSWLEIGQLNSEDQWIAVREMSFIFRRRYKT